MQHQVQPAKLAPHRGKHRFDVFVLGDVTGQNERLRPERPSQFFDVFLQARALVGKGKGRALARPGLGNGPRDGAFVRDTKYDPEFSRQQGHVIMLKDCSCQPLNSPIPPFAQAAVPGGWLVQGYFCP